VMVIVYWPVAAAPLTDKVSVLVLVVEVGLNDALTSTGVPLALSATAWLKPAVGTTVIVVVPPSYRGTEMAAGDAVIVKFPTATVRVTFVVAVRLPEVPVIVTVTVPEVAVLLAVSVRMLVVVAGFTLKEAVTPVGKPEAASVTFPENPFTGVMVIVLLPPVPPLSMVSAVGDAERLKLCARITVRLMVVVCVKLPDVPVTVTVTVPVAAVALAVKVNVLVEVTGLGLKVAVTPVGKPEADTLTFPLKPFDGVIVIVLVPLLPCVMLSVLGLADSE
jgi:hypothetical protein